jgi:DNA-binding GntR family transcriptional regulator
MGGMAIRHVRPVDADGLEAGAVLDGADARAAQLAKLRGIADVIRSDHGTSHDLVLVALRGAIVAGVLEPGTRLRQEELAELFGTSRIPVREALRALQYEGLVTSEPNHTSTVSPIDPDDIDELFDLRILVEGHALRLGVPLLTPEDIAELQALRDAIAALPPDDQPAAVDRFYLRLYAATGRPRLVELVAASGARPAARSDTRFRPSRRCRWRSGKRSGSAMPTGPSGSSRPCASGRTNSSGAPVASPRCAGG